MSVDALRKTLQAVKSPQAKKLILKQIRTETLVDQIRACRACGLGMIRNRAVPWSGPTEGAAELIIVGEAPGAEEDKKGVPFVGRSGALLDLLLERSGTSRDRCFVVNTLACRPPDNRDPRPEELEACRPNFDDQLAISGAFIGVCLGGYALANVLGIPREQVVIKETKETVFWKDGRIWLSTYHPSYALRNIDAQAEIKKTLEWALNIYHGDLSIPRPDKVAEWKEIGLVDGSGRNIGEVLKKQKWVLIHSKVLNTQIVVKLSDFVKVPTALDGVPVYLLDEWVKMGQAGAKRGGWTVDELRRMHFVKAEMGGTVMTG